MPGFLGCSNGHREVYHRSEVGGKDHLGHYKPWIRGSDFKYKCKPLEHFNLHLYFKKITLDAMCRLAGQDDRGKAWEGNLWRLL